MATSPLYLTVYDGSVGEGGEGGEGGERGSFFFFVVGSLWLFLEL